MRHLLSIVLSLILAPLVYLSTGYATIKLAEATAKGSVSVVPALLGVLAVGLAGALYSVLVLARLSPIGTVLAGLFFFAISIWALLAPAKFGRAMPDSVAGVAGVATAGVGAVTFLIAVPLVVTVASPRRWRRGTAAATGPTGSGAPYAAGPYGAPVYTPTGYTPPTYTSPSYPTPDSGAPVYTPTGYGSPADTALAGSGSGSMAGPGSAGGSGGSVGTPSSPPPSWPTMPDRDDDGDESQSTRALPTTG